MPKTSPDETPASVTLTMEQWSIVVATLRYVANQGRQHVPYGVIADQITVQVTA
jgi:hypothetical protein